MVLSGGGRFKNILEKPFPFQENHLHLYEMEMVFPLNGFWSKWCGNGFLPPSDKRMLSSKGRS